MKRDDLNNFRPHPDVVRASQMLDDIAKAYSFVMWQLHQLEQDTDSMPVRTIGDGMPHGSTEDTSVERAALARWNIQSTREQHRDDLETVTQVVGSLIHGVNHTIATFLEPTDAKRCDGRDFAGAGIPWAPHSRDETNGWRDPSCQEFADQSGLCPRCRVRERRWRDRNGLAPRQTSVAEGVGA